MRDLNRTATNKPTSQIGRLESIHRLINAKIFNQELIEEKMSDINPDYLTHYSTAYFKYLNARYHFRLYQIEDALEHLELSSSLLDDMEYFVRENKDKINISGYEYHFTRAYVRMLMVKLSWDEYWSPIHLNKAKAITERTLQYNPENNAFKWLQQQLAA